MLQIIVVISWCNALPKMAFSTELYYHAGSKTQPNIENALNEACKLIFEKHSARLSTNL